MVVIYVLIVGGVLAQLGRPQKVFTEEEYKQRKREYRKKYREAHKEHLSQLAKKYRRQNQEKYRRIQREQYAARRLKENPNHKYKPKPRLTEEQKQERQEIKKMRKVMIKMFGLPSRLKTRNKTKPATAIWKYTDSMPKKYCLICDQLMAPTNLYYCGKRCESRFRTGLLGGKPICCKWTPSSLSLIITTPCPEVS